MFGLYNFFDRLKQGFAFRPEEIKSLLMAIIVLTFILGFDDGRQSFELLPWFLNLINCLLVITLAILVRETAHRLAAIKYGHQVEMKLWGVGLGASLLISLFIRLFFPSSKFLFLVYGGIVLSIIPRQRLGHFRFGLSYNDMAAVAFWGNISNLLLALFFKIFTYLPNPLIRTAMEINLIMAVINMLPFPPLTGSIILFSHRTFYVFSLVLVLVASAFMLTSSVLVTLIGSVIIAALLALLYNVFFELK